MNKTPIIWTEYSWNPASGCHRVSPGCKHCYAMQLAEQKRGTRAFPYGFDPTVKPWKLDEPRSTRAPSLIFVNSMSDLFLKEFGHEYRDKVFEVIRATPRHRYQILTKRPEVMLDYYSSRGAPPPNVWQGVTIESDTYTKRADMLRQVDATVLFISAEPLLSGLPSLNFDGIHWLITGGESGNHLGRDDAELDRRGLVRRGTKRMGARGGPRGWMLRDDRAHWLRDLRDRCDEAGVAFFHKQHGGPTPKSGGRLLDGLEHDGMPANVPGAMPGEAQASLPIVA